VQSPFLSPLQIFLYFVNLRYSGYKCSQDLVSFGVNGTGGYLYRWEIELNYRFLHSDQRLHTSWPRNIQTCLYRRSRIVITNLSFLPCIYIRKLRSQFWLEEFEELRWESNRIESNPFQLLIIVQKMKNLFAIDFPEPEFLTQNTLDYILMNV
jgi:hypothetical protein